MNASLDLNSGTKDEVNCTEKEHNSLILFPQLACEIHICGDHIFFSRDGLEFRVQTDDIPIEDLHNIFISMDGTRTIKDIQQLVCTIDIDSIESIVKILDQHLLVNDVETLNVCSGITAILEIEDLLNDLLYKTLYKNVFWSHVNSPDLNMPINVLYGLAIENYHFLFRESYFDSPVLSFQSSTKARLLMNEFYCEEYGHDELILRSLNSIGISREDLLETMPLPETMAMCNCLAYWASYDPLFFFTTLGVLEGKNLSKDDVYFDSYIRACEQIGLNSHFIEPIKHHASINLKGEHGNLTRRIFKEIPYVDEKTLQRLRRQTYLFIEMYNNFYTAIWNYYSSTNSLLRRVSTI